MNDYINRQEAIDFIDAGHLVNPNEPRWSDNEVVNFLRKRPSVDVKPVRHGRWETVEGWDGDELYRCSECGDEFVLIEGTPKDNNYWFCPCCGAKMDGEHNETD